ncbi:MAG TPA: thioredoxin domain-containing protein [Polyangiaceae bacterium]|nr:thioredoxin domain-containing protein [Polyangiaceae bacterium]
MSRRSLALLGLALAAGCAASPPPEPAAGTNTDELELAKSGSAPAWPAGLVPCAKDAPEGSSCAVGHGAAPAASAASAPPGSDATTVWSVPVGPDDPARGPADALVTLVVFSDFECPFCKRSSTTLARVVTELPADVRLVWKDLPLPMHAHSESAAELARFARASRGDAGFWKAHDLLYASQDSLGESTFRRIAGQLGLPWTPAWASIRAAKFGASIQADVALSDRVLVEATPTTFVNGIKLVGAQPYERTRALVDAELTKARDRVRAGTARASLYAAIVSKGVQVEPHTDTQPP